MSEFEHWCGNCQIRIYYQQHFGKTLTWQDCPYTCEYATAIRCSIKPSNCGADMRSEAREYLEYGKLIAKGIAQGLRGDSNEP